MFGLGGGAFTGAQVFAGGAGGVLELGQFLSAGDFDGNGIVDLALADSENAFLEILKGAGNGAFSETARYPIQDPVAIPAGLAVADFNRDGKNDVAMLTAQTPGSPTAMIELFLARGDGTLLPPAKLDVPGGSAVVGPYGKAGAIASADWNGDGIPDLAVAGQGGVWVWLGKGDGTFTGPSSIPLPNAHLTSLVAGDFNRDGKLDLAVADPVAQTVTLLAGRGDGTFYEGITIAVPPFPGPNYFPTGPASLIAADFNGDGNLDLAASFGTGTGNPGEGGLAVLLGDGHGSFFELSTDPEDVGAFLAADINGDGIPDLVASDGALGTIVRLGNGDGTFQPAAQIVAARMQAYAAADFNGDGKIDIAGGELVTGVSTLLNLSAAPPALTIVSAASYLAGPFAPGEIVSGFGTHLAIDPRGATTKVAVRDAAGVTRPAVAYYGSPRQVNFVLPSGTATGTATVTVTAGDSVESTAQIAIVPIAPALSTEGTAGIAAAYAIRVNPDLSQTILPVFTAQAGNIVPAPLDLTQPGQVYLLLFGTGFDGATAATTTVTVQGVPAPVQYAGPQLSFAGLDQIGALLPASLAGTGLATVEVTISGVAANRVFIDVQ
jgi:uncharacterized protein (TIGR03437 family)